MNKNNIFYFIIFILSSLILVVHTDAQQINREIKKIVIDPGFGGTEKGAPGCEKGVYSKDINLEIAKRVAKRIHNILKIDVIMTREKDESVTLEKRITTANENKADLFISIHVNAGKDIQAYGIETYYLNVVSNDINASKEKYALPKNESDLQTITSGLTENSKISRSGKLADNVQNSVCRLLSEKYSKINNRGTKQSPLYVLLGTDMPAVVIGTSFISNPRECKRLTSEEYQDDLSKGIVEGIRNYIKELNSKQGD
ncbi:MAG: N-acetylmuramoyl-L-alanine amidase [Desulfobacterales bacterium]|nr:N-acetylmuramoyl-L-alanine amidase [Desulfobacterales bacterium]